MLLLAFMAVGGVALVLMSRGDGSDSKSDEPAASASKPDAEASPADGAGTDPDESAPPKKVLAESACPADLSNCVVASGRVLYVEKVDPDGDGDAHFVTASTSSVTGPGITIFDVRTDLRPDPLPGVGDLVGGAGPVYPGHAGQKQIEVIAFEVAE